MISPFAYALIVPALTLLLPFLALPIVILAITSVHGLAAANFATYLAVVTDPFYLRIYLNTVLIALVVVAIAFAAGYPISYFFSRFSRRSRMWLIWILYLPLIVSVVVRVFGWMILLADRGLVNQFMLYLGVWEQPARIIYEVPGMIIGMVHRYLPMMVLPIAASIAKTPTVLWRASINLGSTPARTFFRVEMPLSLPGIVAGSQLVFASVLSDYVLPTLLGTTRFKMLAPAIYEEAIGRVEWPTAAAMSCLSLILLAVLLLATTSLLRRWAPWTRT